MHSGIQHLYTPSSQKGFSLLELVIVLIILSVLIIASRNIFQTPQQYLLESERCIASLDGHVRQFFYNAVSGKSLTVSGSLLSVDDYSLVFQTGATTFQILGGYVTQSGDIVTTTVLSPTNGSNITLAGCSGDDHSVYIAGSVGSSVASNIRIDIRKNLQDNGVNRPMSICVSNSDNNCIDSSSYTTGLIQYHICKTGTSGCGLDIVAAAHLFDIRTQTIKFKRCLSLPIDGECKRRSSDEF